MRRDALRGHLQAGLWGKGVGGSLHPGQVLCSSEADKSMRCKRHGALGNRRGRAGRRRWEPGQWVSLSTCEAARPALADS